MMECYEKETVTYGISFLQEGSISAGYKGIISQYYVQLCDRVQLVCLDLVKLQGTFSLRIQDTLNFGPDVVVICFLLLPS